MQGTHFFLDHNMDEWGLTVNVILLSTNGFHDFHLNIDMK
jgi:hypothetical protein